MNEYINYERNKTQWDRAKVDLFPIACPLKVSFLFNHKHSY